MTYDHFQRYEFLPSELRQLQKRLTKARRKFANRLHIMSMPVRSATMADVESALEDLVEEHKFRPDMVILDSADHLRASESYDGSFRLQQSEVYWASKRLAEEGGYVVVTSTHAGREWAKKIATAEATSEAYDKSRIADAVFSLNDPAEMKSTTRRTVIQDDDDSDVAEVGEPSVQPGMRLMELYLGKYRAGDSRFKVSLECDFARMLMRELNEKEIEDDEHE